MSNGSTHGDRLSEAEFTRRARHGDPGAWETIVSVHREAVFRYAYLQVGDRAEAEDVAQETFLRAYRSSGRYDAARPLRPWLLRIARNVARNRWRGWMRRVRATDRWTTDAELDRAPHSGNPDVDLTQAAEVLRQAVGRMRDEDRQVIYLRFHLGLSVEETGEALGIPPGTVKSRLSRALGRLRESVQRDHPDLRKVLDE